MRAPGSAIAILVFLMAQPASAQPAEPSGDGEKVAETAPAKDAEVPLDLVANLERLRGEVQKLEREARSAKGDNRAIALEQLDEERANLLALVGDVLGDEAQRTKPALALAAAVIDGEGRRAAAELKTAQRRLKRLLALRDRKRGTELIELDDDIHVANSEIDDSLADLDANVGRRAKLGAEKQPEREQLRELLPLRASQLAASVRALGEELSKVGARKASSDAAKADKDDAIAGLQRRLESSISSLGKTVELLKKYELDAAEYQQLLIEATGDVTSDILDSEVALGLGRKYLSKAKRWFAESGPTLLFKLVLFIIILLIAKLLAALARRLSHVFLRRSKNASGLLKGFVGGMVSRLIMIVGVLVGLWQFGFSPTSILAGVGLVGLIIGLALQSTLSSFASGMLILIYRPFDIGDLIETNGHKGTVLEMSLMATVLLTLDNQRIVVPNSKVWNEPLKNINCEPLRRVDMVFGISYADDCDQAREILDEILATDERVVADPEPIVRVHELGASSVDFVVRPWVKPDDYWDVYWDVTRAVKVTFDERGISIPFPQRDIHIVSQPAAVSG